MNRTTYAELCECMELFLARMSDPNGFDLKHAPREVANDKHERNKTDITIRFQLETGH
jgi:hypothetical protein